MEVEKPNGEIDDGELECWISSSVLDQFKTQVQTSLSHLSSTQTDETAKPLLKIYKYPQFMINVAIRHLINNNHTDFIEEFRMFAPDDYEIIKQMTNEIHEAVTEALLDDSFTCTFVEIFGSDLVAVRVKL